MSKSNIEQLIADKLQSLSFDFKPEYWDAMSEKLDADCAQTKKCSTASIGGFYSASLLVVFFGIISILLFFPWEINKSIGTNSATTMEISIDKNTTPIQISPEINKQAIVEQENKNIDTEAIINNKSSNNKKATVSKTHKHHKKAISQKHTKVSKNNTNQSVINDEGSNIDTQVVLSKNKDITSKSPTKKEDLQVKSELDNTEIEQGITTDTLSTNAVYTYEAELGDEPSKVDEKETQIKIQKKPVPVKHVRTRSKPVKRVFKRKRGLLYRLGIRK